MSDKFAFNVLPKKSSQAPPAFASLLSIVLESCRTGRNQTITQCCRGNRFAGAQ